MKQCSLVLFFAMLLAAGSAAAAGFLKFGGSPLTRSVRNESEAAMDRGCVWLVSEQGEDGSWNDDIRLTAISVLALAGTGEETPQEGAAAIARAVAWLEAQHDSPAPQSALLWRAFALAVTGRGDANSLPPLPPPPANDATPAERAFWYAHAMNAVFDGEPPLQTAATATDLDWRSSLASQWTTSQKIDTRGRGHWGKSIETTAFAILLLNEL